MKYQIEIYRVSDGSIREDIKPGERRLMASFVMRQDLPIGPDGKPNHMCVTGFYQNAWVVEAPALTKKNEPAKTIPMKKGKFRAMIRGTSLYKMIAKAMEAIGEGVCESV